jgi:N-acetylmuramoyl-L-alanine amidase
VFSPARIILSCLVLGLAGCVSTPPESAPEPPAPPTRSATNAVVKPTVTLPPPALFRLAPTTNVNQPGIHFNPTPVLAPQPALSVPATTWSSLNRWAVEHHTGRPHPLAASPVVSYALGSKQGVLVVEIGSRDATWNGTGLHLGFAPEMIDGEVFVHSLDLEKNFAPLLCDAPALPEADRVIVIDPGHGGREGGTLSVLDGQPEKTFTLDWARRLAPLLEAKGWHVLLTRTNDADMAVTNRVTFAVAHHADLFISLHFNSAAPDRKQAGLETYCLTPTGLPSTLTRGYPDILSLTFPVNAFDAQSLQLALRLQNSILRATKTEDRGIRRARFMGMLRGQHCPAVLIEGGYLSNPREAQLIESGEYRQKLAVAVAAALP